MSSIEELSHQIRKMREKFGWQNSDTPNILAKSIVVEANELLACFLDEDCDLLAVREELADVLMYALSLAEDLDLDVEELIKEKIAIVNQRNYDE